MHIHELRDTDGNPYTITAYRRLTENGEAIELELVARVPGQPDHRALQVYRRVTDR